MFDVGFSELALIFGVSLLVLGPKRLPGLVSKVGRWVGKARSMARDFQQQLENEVNLEELQKMTEARTRAVPESMPAPPPEFTGAPSDTDTPTYPYSAADSSTAESSGNSETSSAESSGAESSSDSAQTDDTYSHAHAAGDAPMADVAGSAAAERAYLDEPVQADLDLSGDSHLPPDDARRDS